VSGTAFKQYSLTLYFSVASIRWSVTLSNVRREQSVALNTAKWRNQFTKMSLVVLHFYVIWGTERGTNLPSDSVFILCSLKGVIMGSLAHDWHMTRLSRSEYVHAPPDEHYQHISLRARTLGDAALIWSSFRTCKIFELIFLAQNLSTFCLCCWNNEKQLISSGFIFWLG
jgi:hypothetical protein